MHVCMCVCVCVLLLLLLHLLLKPSLHAAAKGRARGGKREGAGGARGAKVGRWVAGAVKICRAGRQQLRTTSDAAAELGFRFRTVDYPGPGPEVVFFGLL